MENEAVTNPAEETVAVGSAPAPEVTENDEPNLAASEPDENADADGEAPEQEEEFIDIEKDGKTYKVPKSIESLLMFQKDYTQKTQAHAEQRREFEAQRQAKEWEFQTREALFREEAQLVTVSERLEQFQNLNWQALAQQDMQQYVAAQAEYTHLKDYHDRLSGHVEGRRAELAAKQEQDKANALTKAVEFLNKPRPEIGWDGKFDAKKSQELTEFGLKFGFQLEELKNTSHPLMIQGLHLMKWAYDQIQKQSAALKPQSVEAKPVPQVAATRSRSAVSNPDKLPIDQWVKWRERQIAKNRAS